MSPLFTDLLDDYLDRRVESKEAHAGTREFKVAFGRYLEAKHRLEDEIDQLQRRKSK